MINIAGMRFGRFLVLDVYEKKKGSRSYLWKCRCDCGEERFISGSLLRKGHTKSCGCLKRDRLIKHGLAGHSLYKVFHAIKGRCYKKNDSSYQNYGGRGIKVCDKWLNDFKAFYDWAIVNGWKKGLEIDRKDNDGNYEPDNCRFVTHIVNDRNTRQSKWWVVADRIYPSAMAAAKAEGVSTIMINRWCGTFNDRPHKRRSDCYAYFKY